MAGQVQDTTKTERLARRLKTLRGCLEEIERGLEALERAWGGNPLEVDAAALLGTPDWYVLHQARGRYALLREEQEWYRARVRELERALAQEAALLAAGGGR